MAYYLMDIVLSDVPGNPPTCIAIPRGGLYFQALA
jgi:hypothetical protein